MTDLNYSESLDELQKLIQLMDEDSSNLSIQQLVSDYLAPILDSMVSEIGVNRQGIVQTHDRVSLALLMAEKTFLGDVLTSIAEHFATVIEELPSDTDPESKLGVALGEVQDLLATWMNFEMENSDEDSDEDEDEDEDDGDDTSVETVDTEVVIDA